MPITQSVKKALRQNIKKRKINRKRKTAMKAVIKDFKKLLDELNKNKREEAKYVRLVALDKDYIELSYFKKEDDALYTKRKLRKISKLAFKEEYVLSVEAIKDID